MLIAEDIIGFACFSDWEEYVSIIPQEERNDMISAYYKRLTSDDKAVRSEAAKRWSVWECSTSRLMIDPDYIKKAYEDDFSDKFARIEFSSFSDFHHYLTNLFLV